MEQGEKMVDVARSPNVRHSAIGMILKSKDKLTECVEICCAHGVERNVAEAWESD